jgi:hypothetical protein
MWIVGDGDGGLKDLWIQFGGQVGSQGGRPWTRAELLVMAAAYRAWAGMSACNSADSCGARAGNALARAEPPVMVVACKASASVSVC